MTSHRNVSRGAESGVVLDNIPLCLEEVRARNEVVQAGLRARTPAIDGVRAIAILLVIALHFQIVPKSNVVEQSLFLITNFGWTGVDLFFVLSGYLITGILLKTKNSPSYYLTFYMRRVLRIFPLYYLLLFVAIGVGLARGQSDAGFPVSPVWYLLYCQNILMVGASAVGGVYMVTWSLAVEEQYYLVWPMICRKLNLRSLAKVLVGLLCAAPLIRAFFCIALHDPRAAYVLTPCRMDALAAGGLVALLGHTRSLREFRKPAIAGVAIGSSAIVVIAGAQHNFGYLEIGTLLFGVSSLALLFSSLLLLVLSLPEGSIALRWLSARWLCSVGRYSYAMYLLHLPVKSLILAVVPRLATPKSVPYYLGTQWICQLFFYALASAVTFGLAWLSWHVLEGRVLALKERWRY